MDNLTKLVVAALKWSYEAKPPYGEARRLEHAAELLVRHHDTLWILTKPRLSSGQIRRAFLNAYRQAMGSLQTPPSSSLWAISAAREPLSPDRSEYLGPIPTTKWDRRSRNKVFVFRTSESDATNRRVSSLLLVSKCTGEGPYSTVL